MYNRVAGQSVERIGALSDGLFAIAMTLIALEIRVPAGVDIHSDHDLWLALVELGPRFLTYVLSFLTLGIFWTGQQTQLQFLTHANRDLAWVHFGFLAVTALLPFSTTLLAQYLDLRLALAIYWVNMLLAGIILLMAWHCAVKGGLVKADAPPNLTAAIYRRIIIAQSLYAIGALLAIYSTRWSIGFIVLVQLNYAFAPRIKWLYEHL